MFKNEIGKKLIISKKNCIINKNPQIISIKIYESTTSNRINIPFF